MALATARLDTKSKGEGDVKPLWTERDNVQERFLRSKIKRIKVLKQHAEKFYPGIREGRMIYEGKIPSTDEKKDKRDFEHVMPLAKSFVEAKTSEEVKAMNEYEYTPVKSNKDSWKVELIKDVNAHVDRRIKKRAKRHRMTRNKNIDGLSLKRKGYRKTMRWIKERVESDDDARGVVYKRILVPMYDDLFEDMVSPFEFAIDPNKTLDEAMDCVHTHIENPESFKEIYGHDPRFINVDKVKPGAKFTFDNQGNFVLEESIKDDSIVIEEYFNKILDEWVMVANGVLITPVTEEARMKDDKPILDSEGNEEKVFIANPLPDDHKELPFVSYHNDTQFVIEIFGDPSIVSPDGEAVSSASILEDEEVFWTRGDPLSMRELIQLDTGFTRAMFRNLKISSEVIVATDKGYKFKNKGWKTGDQAVGMKGKFEVVRLAESTAGDIRQMLDYLFTNKVLLIGIDPRNLSQDAKTKTATEAAIMRETSMARLENGIEYNEENGETRDGMITFKLIQQYYSKPEVVRITGLESEEELKRFDEVEEDEDGKALAGKRYRLIPTSLKLKERRKKRKDGTYKYYLSEDETGVNSFLSRPEYVRSSEVDITVSTKRKAGEIRAVNAEQSMRLIELYTRLYELTVPTVEGQPAAIDREDLPDLKEEIKILRSALGRPDEIKDEEEDTKDEDAVKTYKATRVPLTSIPPPVDESVAP